MIEWQKTKSGECQRLQDVPKGAEIIAINDRHVVDTCEACSMPILEGDKYVADFEGICLCQRCIGDAKPEPSAPVSGKIRGSDISDSLIHDAGAYARCFHCGRYTDDPTVLNDMSSFPCNCGRNDGWSGSFEKPTADSKWKD